MATGAEVFLTAFKTVVQLRHNGLKVEFDLAQGSMKSQMKKANRAQAKQVLIFGEEEFARGSVILRNRATAYYLRMDKGEL